MTKPKLKATSLKNTMISIIVIIIIIAIAGFYFMQDYLNKEFITDNASKPTANLAVDFADITKEISVNKVRIESVDSFYTNSENYKNIVNDNLTKYANLTGIVIAAKDWQTDDVSNKTKLVTITIKNPVSIDKFIKFVKAVEDSLPKMNLSSLSIKPVAKSNTLITVDPIMIEVYTK